ncbi:unnamed protein product [Bubo scandiacus]
MLALAPAFPLYQEGLRPVATMPRPPRLAPAVCGTWSGAVGAQRGCCGEKRTVTPPEWKAPGWDYSCCVNGVRRRIPTPLLVKLVITKHASKVSLSHMLTILHFCEFVKECFFLAQKI